MLIDGEAIAVNLREAWRLAQIASYPPQEEVKVAIIDSTSVESTSRESTPTPRGMGIGSRVSPAASATIIGSTRAEAFSPRRRWISSARIRVYAFFVSTRESSRTAMLEISSIVRSTPARTSST